MIMSCISEAKLQLNVDPGCNIGCCWRQQALYFEFQIGQQHKEGPVRFQVSNGLKYYTDKIKHSSVCKRIVNALVRYEK